MESPVPLVSRSSIALDTDQARGSRIEHQPPDDCRRNGRQFSESSRPWARSSSAPPPGNSSIDGPIHDSSTGLPNSLSVLVLGSHHAGTRTLKARTLAAQWSRSGSRNPANRRGPDTSHCICFPAPRPTRQRERCPRPLAQHRSAGNQAGAVTLSPFGGRQRRVLLTMKTSIPSAVRWLAAWDRNFPRLDRRRCRRRLPLAGPAQWRRYRRPRASPEPAGRSRPAEGRMCFVNTSPVFQTKPPCRRAQTPFTALGFRPLPTPDAMRPRDVRPKIGKFGLENVGRPPATNLPFGATGGANML